MRMKALWIVVGGLLVCSPLLPADELQSGPQVGATLPAPFPVLSVVHADKPDAAGKKWDYVEQYGQNPVVLVFARTGSDPLTKLLKTVDAEVARHNRDNKKLHALLVMLADDDDLEKKLKDLAEKHGITHVSLSIDNPAGPPKWRIAQDADVTVILY